MTACINESVSIEVHRKAREEKPCLRIRKLRPDQASHVVEVAHLHCPYEVVVGLKRERTRMRYHIDADAYGSCSKVGGNCSSAKNLRVCEP